MVAVQATRIAVLSAAFVIAAAVASAANAGTEQVLHAFRGFPAGDGANPLAAPIMDGKGNLYGTASAGGGSGCGMVYELHKTRNGTWKETVLYNFTCGDDGLGPEGGLVFDKAGNLYGTTELGGTGTCFYGCGVVYKLSPGGGSAWTETVLYAFPQPPEGSQYGGPLAGLTFDGKGTLFGTTVLDDACGGFNYGSIFQLKLVGGAWKEHDIRDFCGNDGADPGYGALVLDSAGNFYGTTMFGGASLSGVVFELTPLGHGKWSYTHIHDFTEEEGGELEGGLTIDASGNLYGAEYRGGSGGHGAIYEFSPAGGAWSETILHVFTGAPDSGQLPWASPVFDGSGNLFGTTQGGGSTAYCINCGVIYELVPQGDGQWSESVVYGFGSQEGLADGDDPVAGLIRGADGNFYGTTVQGGDKSCNCGVVFEYTP